MFISPVYYSIQEHTHGTHIHFRFVHWPRFHGG